MTLTLTLVLTASLAVPGAGQDAAAQAQTKSVPRSASARRAAMVAWCRDNFMAHYHKSLKPGQTPAPEVEAALALYANPPEHLKKATNRRRLLALTRGAFRVAPEEPLLELAAGDAWFMGSELKQSPQMLERARQRLASAGPFVRIQAATRCMTHARFTKDEARADLLHKEVGALLLQLANEPTCAGPNQRNYFTLVIDHFDQVPREFIDELAKTSAPRWVILVLDGLRHIDEAWEARGEKTADKVATAGWQGFERHLREADKALRAAHEMEPDLPEAATGMIAVATGLDRPAKEVRAWFDRAVAAQYDFGPAYHDFFWFSLPRWGGSHASMLSVGRACLAAGRFDTEVPGVFRDCLRHIAGDYDDPGRLYGKADNLDGLRRLHEGLMAHYRSRAARASLTSAHVAVLALGGQAAEAARHYQALDGELDEQVLRVYRVKKDWLQNQMLPHLQPHVPKAMPTFDVFADVEPPTRPVRLLSVPVKDTVQQEHTRYCNWLAATAVASYRDKATKDPRFDATVEQLLQQWASRLYEPTGTPEDQALLQQFEALRTQGCNDPLFAYAHARMLDRDGKLDAVFTKLQGVAEALDQSGYDAMWRFLCKRRLEILMRGRKLEAPATALQKQVRELAVAMASAPQFQGETAHWYLQLVFPTTVFRGDLSSLDERSIAAIADNQAVDRWLRHYLLGLVHCGTIRLTKFGFDPEQDRGHFQSLEAANRELSAAHALRPERPEAAALMISVRALALDLSGAQAWFDKAIAVQFDNPAAYANLAEALRPDLGGSLGALRQFATECLNTERFDTEVPIKWVDIMLHAQEFADSPRWIWASPTVAADYERLVQGYERAAPTSAFVTSLRRGRYHTAWAGGRYADAMAGWLTADKALDPAWLQRLRTDAATVKADLEALAAAAKR